MMDEAENIIKLNELINDICKEHSLDIMHSSNGIIKISEHASGITLNLQIHSPTNFVFYFVIRTTDVYYSGDRTDVHVVMSLMFACFLRSFNSEMSCSIFDVPHPVVPNEIWGRYIMPEQASDFWNINDWDKLSIAISKTIISLGYWKGLFWSVAECPCKECLKENKIDGNKNYKMLLPIELNHSKNKFLKPTSRLTHGARIRPYFSYFYDIENEITIIKSENLSKFSYITGNPFQDKAEIVKGIKGKFILQGDLKNFLADKDIGELKRTYKALGVKTNSENHRIFPLENMIVSVSPPYIVALGRLCGIYKFKVEKENLRVRHNKEANLIFPIPKFEWMDDVCPDQFEGLVKALLEREPNVVSVRKTSPINQGDGGRDLIIEWKIRNESFISKSKPPSIKIKVVGQCKSSKNTISKSKVLDIRDTIESHNSKGYFLAVSTILSAPLTKKMEELKNNGIWTEWWNRDDIEFRLSKNQDLVPLFPLVLKSKFQIKFVQQDEE